MFVVDSATVADDAKHVALYAAPPSYSLVNPYLHLFFDIRYAPFAICPARMGMRRAWGGFARLLKQARQGWGEVSGL